MQHLLDVLARSTPRDLSALNILPVTVIAIREGSGPGMIVQLQFGNDRLLARITRRSASALELKPGDAVHAVIKSVSVAPLDVARG